MEININNLVYKGFSKINLKIKSNTITGIIGEETNLLLKILTNYNISYSKCILFNNKEMSDETYSNISYIKKVPKFLTNIVCDEINLFYNKNKENEINLKDIIKEYLEIFKLDKNFINKKIDDLSSGEKKVLQIITGLVYNPSIIIFSDPYFNLDYNNKKIVMNLIYMLKKQNKTVIINSIDINDIYEICDELIVLNKRKVYLYDKTINVFKNDKYYELGLDIPNIVKFINLAKEKGINLPYQKDIRDLIKDVYRNV